mgnify:CR=1 FL=1
MRNSLPFLALLSAWLAYPVDTADACNGAPALAVSHCLVQPIRVQAVVVQPVYQQIQAIYAQPVVYQQVQAVRVQQVVREKVVVHVKVQQVRVKQVAVRERLVLRQRGGLLNFAR